jgi:hypothetical protein
MAKTRRLTKTRMRTLAEELLNIRSIYDRYRVVEKELKEGMAQLGMLKPIEIEGRGNVFISQFEMTSYEPDLARSVLGEELAGKVIEVKESVKNDLVKALVKTGDISEEAFKRLDEGAKKTPRINLYVRPLD